MRQPRTRVLASRRHLAIDELALGAGGGGPGQLPKPVTHLNQPVRERATRTDYAESQPRYYAAEHATTQKHGSYDRRLLNGDGTLTARGGAIRYFESYGRSGR
jgi:hypothetical protein